MLSSGPHANGKGMQRYVQDRLARSSQRGVVFDFPALLDTVVVQSARRCDPADAVQLLHPENRRSQRGATTAIERSVAFERELLLGHDN